MIGTEQAIVTRIVSAILNTNVIAASNLDIGNFLQVRVYRVLVLAAIRGGFYQKTYNDDSPNEQDFHESHLWVEQWPIVSYSSEYISTSNDR
ncbi:Uncharacterised protein [Cedecea neteri]|uniref:Uncharacterized protein n=1 Tax=Cedecea neteri TaxID=158822 RepID=A0A2X2T009_9ENTR|nr:Uncharacterised protein [Cedecea neteri]